MLHLFGIPVFASPFCNRIVSVRQHKKRRNQSATYHRRVQKKWTKRFGTKVEKVAYLIGGNALGNQSLVLHPEHLVMLRNMGPNVPSDRLAEDKGE